MESILQVENIFFNNDNKMTTRGYKKTKLLLLIYSGIDNFLTDCYFHLKPTDICERYCKCTSCKNRYS